MTDPAAEDLDGYAPDPPDDPGPDATPAQLRQYAREDRRVRVMRMRNSGLSLTAISERVGVGVQTVRNDIDAALSAVLSVPTDQYVARQLTQIDDLRRSVYARALQGDDGAVDRAIRLMERESRLLGLDAPARAVVHVSTEDFAETAATLLRDIGVEPPPALQAADARRYRPDDPDATVLDAEIDPIIAAADDEEVDDEWVV